MKISVVITTYNRREILARTLPTVFAQDFPAEDFEVVVVVDGSSDGTVEWLRGLKPVCGFQVLVQANRGPSAARNAGIEAAKGELILFLDDDLLCDPVVLQEHVAAHSGPGSRVVFGPIFLASESPSSLATDWMRDVLDGFYNQFDFDAELRWPDHAWVGPNCSLYRAMLLACGAYDESLLPRRMEDIELGWRLGRQGVVFRYRRRARTEHLGVKSARLISRGDGYLQGWSEVRFCRKHPEYRSRTSLDGLAQGAWLKRPLRELAVRSPLSPEPLLRLPFWFAERLRMIPAVRRAGMRLLQARQAIEVSRGALREAGSWEALQAEFGMRLPVLLYHHVGPSRPGIYPELSIAPAQFERHVRWLARRGYVGVRPSEWLAWCREGKALPRKPVLLTFDDAYADVAEYALPVLRHHGFSAVVYVVTGLMGESNVWDQAEDSGPLRLMSTEEIRVWAAQGIEFGAHSRTHPDVSKLTGLRLEDEVAGSGEDLAKLLGTRVLSFAYPYGAYNEEVLRTVRKSFDLAFTTEEGFSTLGTPLELLPRKMMYPRDSLLDLAFAVNLGWNPFEHLRIRAARGKHYVARRARGLFATQAGA